MGRRQAVLGVGAGIVFDSVASDEYQECQLKAGFLTGLASQFSIFETMCAYPGSDGHYLVRHWERHLARLTASAQNFGIPVDPEELRQQIDAACVQLESGLPRQSAVAAYRMKLSVDGAGRLQIQTALLHPLMLAATSLVSAPSAAESFPVNAETTPTVKVLLAPTIRNSGNLWLFHKTTNRAIYDAAWKKSEQSGAFDMLFFNERGELTEGGRSNVAVRLDGRWYTPPISAGLLPGVMRAVLLDDPAWAMTERRLGRADLHRAQAIVVCNALRGVMLAQLADPAKAEVV